MHYPSKQLRTYTYLDRRSQATTLSIDRVQQVICSILSQGSPVILDRFTLLGFLVVVLIRDTEHVK